MSDSVERAAPPPTAVVGVIAEPAAGSVAQLVRTATVNEFAVEDMLRELFRVVAQVLGVEGAGVVLGRGDSLRFGAVPSDPSDRGMTALPLLARGRSWGVLELHRSTQRPWTVQDLMVARSFADVVAFYVAAASAQERARIARHHLARLATHDELTGLPNRRLLYDRLESALRSVAGRREAVAVLLIDIDGFQDINDCLGRDLGDLVLCEVARRLARTVRAEDALARLAGARFAVVCEGFRGSAPRIGVQATALGRRIQREFRRPPDPGEIELVLSVSIGAAVTADQPDARTLVGDADRAAYRARQQGRGRLVIGEPSMGPSTRSWDR